MKITDRQHLDAMAFAAKKQAEREASKPAAKAKVVDLKAKPVEMLQEIRSEIASLRAALPANLPAALPTGQPTQAPNSPTTDNGDKPATPASAAKPVSEPDYRNHTLEQLKAEEARLIDEAKAVPYSDILGKVKAAKKLGEVQKEAGLRMYGDRFARRQWDTGRFRN